MKAACGPYIAACVTRATTTANTMTAVEPVASSEKNANAQVAATAPTAYTGRRPNRSDSAPNNGMSTGWHADPARTAVLDEDSMAAWLAAEGYSGRTPAEVFLDRLRAAPAGLTGAEAAARRHVTLALLAGIDAIEAQAAELTRRIKEALAQHPDAPIFTSLPRAGQIRAAALLAEIGDARGRYPDAPTLAAAAGVCPYTDESGKHRSVLFRFKADTKLRRALT